MNVSKEKQELREKLGRPLTVEEAGEIELKHLRGNEISGSAYKNKLDKIDRYMGRAKA